MKVCISSTTLFAPTILMLSLFLLQAHSVYSQKADAHAPTVKRSGYYNYTALGYLFEFPEEDDPSGGNMVAFYPQSVHGYRFSPLLSVGGGVGISMFARGYTMPLVAEIRGDWGTKKVSPHYYLQTGYNLPLYRRPQVNGWGGEPIYEDYKIEGGMTLDAGAGIKVRSGIGIDWVFTLGYYVQKTTESYKEWDWAWITQAYTHQRLSVKMGLMF